MNTPEIIRGLRLFTLGYLLALASGCGNPGVQEDRSINFAQHGESVGFQHGQEGVFVAGGDGKEVKKIFDTADSIAVSSPLWSPVDKRLIFAVAHPANPTNPSLTVAREAWDANPEGRRFQPEDIVYTCMLRTESTGDEEDAEPIELFQAACDHPGYVAANLAVRWHPDGERILFIDRLPEGGHSLFEFDLATQQTRRVLPKTAQALIFDFSPLGQYLCVVLAGDSAATQDRGIWIRALASDDWWQVPILDQQTTADISQDVVEQLRANQPAWTRDDEQFACVVQSNSDDSEQQNSVLAVQLQSRDVRPVYQSKHQLRGLQWHPNGQQLGFVEGASPGSLRILGGDGVVSAPLESENVRQFVGWNHNGSRMAYIAPETAAVSGDRWALLFPRVPHARDRVMMLEEGESQPGHLVHNGVRITFPHWSPSVDELSLWGTYAPSHRSLLSHFLPWTLNPGDPAAILNCDSGDITWMAVNAHEQAQVGHYYLMKRHYEEAWKWYEQSAQKRKPSQPIKLSEFDQFLRRVRIHQDPTFFEYYCLTKLNRPQEAAKRLQQFRSSMQFDLDNIDGFLRPNDSVPDDEQATDETKVAEIQELRTELKAFSEFAIPLLQSSYATEVFLSLDAKADGVEFFRSELKNAKTNAEQLAAMLCQSQLLLASQNYQDYAKLVTQRLAPLLMRLYSANELALEANLGPSQMRRWLQQVVIQGSGGLALLPMLSGEFLSGFTQAELEAQHQQYETLLADVKEDDDRQVVVDVLLLGILAKLDQDEQWKEAQQRVQGHPLFERAREIDLTTPEAFSKDIDAMILQVSGSGR